MRGRPDCDNCVTNRVTAGREVLSGCGSPGCGPISEMNMTFPRILCACLVWAVGSAAQAATVTYFGYGSAWPYRLGTNEASAPDTTAWRTNAADTAGWSLPVTTPIG